MQNHSNMQQCANCVHITWDVPHSLHWRHNGRDSVSNHQPHDCLLKCLFRRRSKKISKRRVTGLCAGNSPESDEFTAQRPVMRKWSHLMMSSCLDKTVQFTELYELKTVVSKFGPNIHHWILLKCYVDSAIIFIYLLNMNNEISTRWLIIIFTHCKIAWSTLHAC